MQSYTEASKLLVQGGASLSVSIAVDAISGPITITEDDMVQDSFVIDRNSISGQNIEIGNTEVSELRFILDNFDRRFDTVIFEGAELTVTLTVGSESWVAGIFTVDQPPQGIDTISVAALDHMVRFDQPYSTALTGKQTLLTILQDSCSACGVVLGTTSFTNDGYMAVIPENLQVNHRQIVSWVAQLAGANAWVDHEGKLRLSWYGENQGTNEIEITQDDYLIDGYGLAENDVVLSGLIYRTPDADYQWGTADYALTIEGNPLIDADNYTDALAAVYSKINGFFYRPYTIYSIPMPWVWHMDMIQLTTITGDVLPSIVTGTRVMLGDGCRMSGSGETATNNGFATYFPFTAQQQAIIQKTSREVMQVWGIDAGWIKTGLLDAARIGAGTISADKLNTNSLSTDQAFADALSANDAFISNLSADQILANGLAANIASVIELDASRIKTGFLSVDRLEAGTIAGSKLTVGAITSRELDTGSVTADTIAAGSVTAIKIAANAVNAAKIAAGAVTTEKLDALSVTTAKLAAGAVTADKIDVADLSADTAFIANLDARYATIASLTVDTAFISDLFSNKLLAGYIDVGSLHADAINASTVNATLANAVAGTINTAFVNDALILNVSASKLTAGTIDAADIDVINLNAENITVGTINGQQISSGAIDWSKLAANVQTPITDAQSDADQALADALAAAQAAGQAQSTADGKNTVYYAATEPTGGIYKANDIWFDTANDNAIHRWSGSAWVASQLGEDAIADLSITNAKIADATIQSAKIANLDAGKITTGTLNAARIGSGSIDTGHLAAGAVTAGILAADSVTADKIAAGEITGAKLNLSDVIFTINESNEQISSNRITLDAESQTLEVAFNSLKSTVGDQESTLTTHGTRLTTVEGEISSKVWMTDITLAVDEKEDSIPKSTTAPSSPAAGQLWLDTSTSPNILKRWDGSAWIKATPTTAAEVDAYSYLAGDQLATRITTAETSITQNTDAIALKASQSDLNTLEGRVTSAESELTVAGDRISMVVSSNVDDEGNYMVEGDNIVSAINLTGSGVLISGSKINLAGIVTLAALGDDFSGVFDTENNRTVIDGGVIKTGSIKAGSIDLYSLTVSREEPDGSSTTTLSISSDGSINMIGSLRSADFTELTGWQIDEAGEAIFNQAIVRGSLLLPTAGATNVDWVNPEDPEDIVKVRYYAGADYDNRHQAPYRVLEDGRLYATNGHFGGTFTGSLELGDIKITDDTPNEPGLAKIVFDHGEGDIPIKIATELTYFGVPFFIGTDDNKRFSVDSGEILMRGSRIRISQSESEIDPAKDVVFPNSADGKLAQWARGAYSFDVVDDQFIFGSNRYPSGPNFVFKNDGGAGDIEMQIQGVADITSAIKMGDVTVRRRTEAGNTGVDFIF